MGIPSPVHLEPHQRGDTWEGLGVLTFTENGAPLSLVGATAEMPFSQVVGGPAALTLSSAGASPKLSITNEAGGVITAVSFELNLAPGLWYWKLTLASPTIGLLTPLWGTIPIRAMGDL